jgi:hypothetical protein
MRSLRASRRRFLEGLGSAVTLGAVAESATATRQSASAWPQYLHDEGNTGFASDAVGPGRRVGAAWQRTPGGGIGTAPVLDGDTVYVGSNDSRVYAIDADSGETVWRFRAGEAVRSPVTAAGGPVTSPPAIRDGTVYLGDSSGQFATLDEASATPTPTPTPEPTANPGTPDPADTTTTADSGESQSPTAASSGGEATTTGSGPGFGTPTALVGLGLGGWRYIRSDDGE